MARGFGFRLTLLVIAVSCAVPAAASAAQLKMGSALDKPPTPALCTNCVGTQTARGSTPFPFLSPINGTITSWSVRTNDAGALYTLRLLKPGPSSGTSKTGAGASVAPSAIPNNTDTVYTYSASLPIKEAYQIGLGLGGAATGLPQYSSGVNSGDLLEYSPNFSDGTTSEFTLVENHELLLQVTIDYCRVPDVTTKKLAEAQALITGAGCSVKVTKHTLKLKRGKSKKTRKKNRQIKAMNGTVLSQGLGVGNSAAPTDPVELVVGELQTKKKKRRAR